MILFDLRCQAGHSFEAWFRDNATYEAQANAGDIACPACGDRHVGKAPMAPRIARSRGRASAEETKQAAELYRKLSDLRAQVEANSDYVGPRFAEEARRIHYGETEARNIHGEATDSEASELKDEGVKFARIPWVPRGEN
ncbi:MAG: DUF1178 family protein [Rhodospirillaceae bacterium]|nr:DUF1178 family protein [Rhodospirillaceae bacterium]